MCLISTGVGTFNWNDTIINKHVPLSWLTYLYWSNTFTLLLLSLTHLCSLIDYVSVMNRMNQVWETKRCVNQIMLIQITILVLTSKVANASNNWPRFVDSQVSGLRINQFLVYTNLSNTLFQLDLEVPPLPTSKAN